VPRIVEQALEACRRRTSAPTCPSASSRRRRVYFAVEARGKIRIPAERRRSKPYRVKLRSPGFSNLSLFAELAQGTLLADAVSILGSLDLVIPEIDR
jgi:NADH-quinone oxidoreductase subunit D